MQIVRENDLIALEYLFRVGSAGHWAHGLPSAECVFQVKARGQEADDEHTLSWSVNKKSLVKYEVMNRFIEDLRALETTLKGKAAFESESGDFLFSLESHGSRGHLLATASYRWGPGNQVRTEIVVEPAPLSGWLEELEDAMGPG